MFLSDKNITLPMGTMMDARVRARREGPDVSPWRHANGEAAVPAWPGRHTTWLVRKHDVAPHCTKEHDSYIMNQL